ncbi:hypothetical protein GQ55_1G017900 [Panicum hallii var. hallii]|uniref:Uncharacterized protein n=1 Tax=Panicum hallii var. hallii TaxID=1504633 RepID=A0A2T7F163_9POAL|nr:hypothetical protein GQ55_1G017900 [Panicum hallii var. hallii]
MGRGLSLPPPAVGGADEVNTSSRPELVGSHLTDTVAVIESQRPDPRDFDPHRVCLFVGDNLTVVRMPVVG